MQSNSDVLDFLILKSSLNVNEIRHEDRHIRELSSHFLANLSPGHVLLCKTKRRQKSHFQICSSPNMPPFLPAVNAICKNLPPISNERMASVFSARIGQKLRSREKLQRWIFFRFFSSWQSAQKGNGKREREREIRRNGRDISRDWFLVGINLSSSYFWWRASCKTFLILARPWACIGWLASRLNIMEEKCVPCTAWMFYR